MILSSQFIKSTALAAGFDLCGIAPCRHLDRNEAHFRAWLDKGYHSTLDYLSRNLDKRFDPRRLVEGARTVVVCAVGYKNSVSEGYPAGCPVKIASYACNEDYHTSLKRMLRTVFAALRERHPQLEGRALVDTAPLLEKQWAVEAGLGWIGRQSLLVTPQLGSYVLLGELVLTLPVDRYDDPFEGSRCGRCNNCIDSCPSGAIVAPHTIDTNRCISRRTIEREGADDGGDLAGWIFGCDRCQSCCPYNRAAPMHRAACFTLLFDPRTIAPGEWLAMDGAEFARRFSGTPLTRSGLERIRENVRRNLRAETSGREAGQ